MAKVVSKVYGDALFSLAVEQNQLDEVWKQVQELRTIICENPNEIDTFLKNESSQIMNGFLAILLEKGRFSSLPAILDYFEQQAKEYQKIGVAEVSSAIPLNKVQKESIEAKLLELSPYESFEMHYEEDPSLIGGMIIRMGDRVLDNSIRGKIERMTKDLKKVSLKEGVSKK